MKKNKIPQNFKTGEHVTMYGKRNTQVYYEN